MVQSVSDSTPTSTVVWTAAKRIGKTGNREELERIGDYLINKNWFQTAGDLRAARQTSAEWQALEIPARLKISIQQVLDENEANDPNSHYFAQCDEPAILNGGASNEGNSNAQDLESSRAEQWWDHQDMNAQRSVDTDSYQNRPGISSAGEGTKESSPAYYAEYTSSYPVPSYADSTNYCDQGLHNYYNDSEYLGSGVASYEGASDPGSQSSYDASTHESKLDTVEAQAIDVEEGQIAPTLVTSGEKTTWSCGQCTFTNPVSEAFCEMCVGHISLSPDYLTLQCNSGTSSLTSTPGEELSKAASEYSPTLVEEESPYNFDAAYETGSSTAISTDVDDSQPSVPAVTAYGPSWSHQEAELPARYLSPPLSPAFAPSAPEFDPDDATNSKECVSINLNRVDDAQSTTLTSNWKPDVVNFLALAFQGKATTSTNGEPASADPYAAHIKVHKVRHGESAHYI